MARRSEGRGVGLAVDVLADVLCALGLCHAHHADTVVAVRRGEVHALAVEGVGDAVAGGLGVVHVSSMAGGGVGVKPYAATNGNDTVTVIVYAMIERLFYNQGAMRGLFDW